MASSAATDATRPPVPKAEIDPTLPKVQTPAEMRKRREELVGKVCTLKGYEVLKFIAMPNEDIRNVLIQLRIPDDERNDIMYELTSMRAEVDARTKATEEHPFLKAIEKTRDAKENPEVDDRRRIIMELAAILNTDFATLLQQLERKTKAKNISCFVILVAHHLLPHQNIDGSIDMAEFERTALKRMKEVMCMLLTIDETLLARYHNWYVTADWTDADVRRAAKRVDALSKLGLPLTPQHTVGLKMCQNDLLDSVAREALPKRADPTAPMAATPEGGSRRQTPKDFFSTYPLMVDEHGEDPTGGTVLNVVPMGEGQYGVDIHLIEEAYVQMNAQINQLQREMQAMTKEKTYSEQRTAAATQAISAIRGQATRIRQSLPQRQPPTQPNNRGYSAPYPARTWSGSRNNRGFARGGNADPRDTTSEDF